jgi:serine/threonine protein phosphatase 1
MFTAQSYNFDYESVPQSHIDFLKYAQPYYIDKKNRAFVHGGFLPDKPIELQSLDILTWDRDLLCNYAPKNVVKGYTHVFVGHTSTQFFGDLGEPKPKTFNNVTGLDTGGGWSGRLTIMNIDTFKFWQTDMNAQKQNALKRLEGLKFGASW